MTWKKRSQLTKWYYFLFSMKMTFPSNVNIFPRSSNVLIITSVCFNKITAQQGSFTIKIFSALIWLEYLNVYDGIIVKLPPMNQTHCDLLFLNHYKQNKTTVCSSINSVIYVCAPCTHWYHSLFVFYPCVDTFARVFSTCYFHDNLIILINYNYCCYSMLKEKKTFHSSTSTIYTYQLTWVATN